MIKPIEVAALPGYSLYLRFEDGVEGEVELSHLVGQGVFAAWKDASAFEKATIGEHGELRWSDEIELCSDALYLQIARKSVEDIFPNLKAAVDA
jgi:hypothetical protein